MISRFLSCLLLSLLAPVCFAQGNQLEIVETPLTAQRLDGTVRMHFDEQPVPNVHVELCDRGWKRILASAITDENGHFHLVRSGNGPMYYIRIYARGVQHSRVHCATLKTRRPELELEISVGT